MINIFNEVYTLLSNALTTYDSNITMSSVYKNEPTTFPFVSVEEIENMVDTNTSDCCDVENHAIVEYEINIYTKDPTKKSKADAIAQVVDTLMNGYNFTRLSKNNIQDSDETIYRIIMRYEAVVSQDHIIYRR